MNKPTKRILKATHGSDKTSLKLGTTEIPCYVLEDGSRVLSGRAMQRALGYEGNAGNWLKTFIGTKSIKENMAPEILSGLLDPIKFKRISSGGSQPVTYGYEATKLIDFCDEIITLNQSGVLRENQLIFAKQAEIIIRSVAKVGIIALVDEATGYQYDRERDALQTILKAYISAELLNWQKTFPDTYYQEIFRLNGWNYTVQDIKKRPGIVGKWTNKIVYEQLPKGVIDELKKNTPKSAAGNYTARFFQSLTSDTGHPHLSAQLNQVIAIMRISDNWKQFITNFNKMVNRKNGQLELGLEDLSPDDN